MSVRQHMQCVVSPPPLECLLTLLPIISLQSKSDAFFYNNTFRLFNQTYMHWAVNTAEVIDDILACVACVRFTKCSSAPRRAKSGEQGREEQPRLINYSRRLCTTPLSAKGRHGCMDGWIDRWRRRRANERRMKVRKKFSGKKKSFREREDERERKKGDEET